MNSAKFSLLSQATIYLSRHRAFAVLGILALVIAAAAMLILGQGIRYIIDAGIRAQNPALLNQALLGMITVAFILSVASYARFYCMMKLGELVAADLRKDLFAHLLTFTPAFYESRKTGEILARLTGDITVIQTMMGGSLSMALRNSITLTGGLVMMAFTSLHLTFYMLLVIPLIVGPILLLSKRVRGLSRKAQDKVAEVAAQAQERLELIKTVQAYNREKAEISSFEQTIRIALDTASARLKMRGALLGVAIFVAFCGIGFVLWQGGHAVLQGTLTPGALTAFLFYAMIVASAIGALSEVAGDIQRASGAAEAVLELLHTQPNITSRGEEGTFLLSAPPAIHMDRITFMYPSRQEAHALHQVAFHVEPGEAVAIVGESGAGKSTLFQLLLRFYDPTEGAVRLNEKDIRELHLSDLRQHFAYVSQEPAIFSASVHENIAYGNAAALEGDIVHAAKQARAHEFIMRLPQGYKTELGERGVRISGGEKQRIALARAFLKKPKILLLDEATNALDADNEALVQAAIRELMEGCTTLVIAHRLSTVLRLPKIIVMRQGRIEAVGSHSVLMQASPYYATLVARQLEQEDKLAAEA